MLVRLEWQEVQEKEISEIKTVVKHIGNDSTDFTKRLWKFTNKGMETVRSHDHLLTKNEAALYNILYGHCL